MRLETDFMSPGGGAQCGAQFLGVLPGAKQGRSDILAKSIRACPEWGTQFTA